MDVIITLFKTQWVFMLLAAVIVAATFVVKKMAPQVYKRFCMIALAVTAILLVVLAIAFKQPDLFLLIPIFILCCELFGYDITGKIVAVFLADYLLICLVHFMSSSGWINDVADTLIFFVLQVVTAVGAGFIMDKHLRVLKVKKQEEAEEKKQAELTENEELDSHIDDIFGKYADTPESPEETDDEEENKE